MKITIRQDVVEIYNSTTPSKNKDPWWAELLEFLAGKTILVDTTTLFPDRFSVFPESIWVCIPEYMVSNVIDDIRIGKGHCGWCGGLSDLPDEIADRKQLKCTECGQKGFVEVLKVR